mmetsp:Transcript_457/g.1106  ORF Transcript_457/g.1106 Transcript_457/m.1106 type:complete len:202 (+) Transcript_457:1085-1690(+)
MRPVFPDTEKWRLLANASCALSTGSLSSSSISSCKSTSVNGVAFESLLPEVDVCLAGVVKAPNLSLDTFVALLVDETFPVGVPKASKSSMSTFEGFFVEKESFLAGVEKVSNASFDMVKSNTSGSDGALGETCSLIAGSPRLDSRNRACFLLGVRSARGVTSETSVSEIIISASRSTFRFGVITSGEVPEVENQERTSPLG